MGSNGVRVIDFPFLLYIALISYHPLKLSRGNRAISFPRQKKSNKNNYDNTENQLL